MMMMVMMMMMRHGRDAGSVHWTWMRHINHRLHLAHISRLMDGFEVKLGHLYRLELQLRELVSKQIDILHKSAHAGYKISGRSTESVS